MGRLKMQHLKNAEPNTTQGWHDSWSVIFHVHVFVQFLFCFGPSFPGRANSPRTSAAMQHI